ncbi:MAG TPA: CoA synthetase [Burkholderiales bacterium]|nr:CoA synthetase [Burkholderiales bacterium]
MSSVTRFTDIDGIMDEIQDGDTIAIPTMLGDFSAVAMNATRAIVRRGRRGLHLVCVPSSSLQADMLIGGGCVASIQAGAVLLYEYGPARRFIERFHDGSLIVKEATCPAIQAGLTAAQKGVPFMPLRGLIGSDVLRVRAEDWKVVDNPFPPHDPIVVVPAIHPDVALFHAPMVDELGNVWIGRRGSLRLMAHAARKTLVTFERRYEGDMFQDHTLVPGLLAAHSVTAVSHQPRGAWPLHFGDEYAEDVAHMQIYAEAARTQAGFDAYVERYVAAAATEMAR